ncbi:Hypothetical predicted protein [Marmota monax]|uniref:Uncharacterized protein n=1 Tax=Marmota monax TaxID=9995 RepID=A0A5E4C9Z0_MARMO|nr:Hypothetical predicted protein [Marmota monax]
MKDHSPSRWLGWTRATESQDCWSGSAPRPRLPAPPALRRFQLSRGSHALLLSPAVTQGLNTGSRNVASFLRGRSQVKAKPLPPIHVPGESDPLVVGSAQAKTAFAFTSQPGSVFLRPSAKMAVPSRRLALAIRT